MYNREKIEMCEIKLWQEENVDGLKMRETCARCVTLGRASEVPFKMQSYYSKFTA